MKTLSKTLMGCVVAVGVAAVGCGGGGSRVPGAQAPVTQVSAAPSASSAPASWSDSLSKEHKVAFMQQVVVPRMGKVFTAHDAKRYSGFGCETCHGAEGKDPHEHLPALTLRGEKLTAFTEAPQVSKFMAEHVVPEMAAVMGKKPYDPQTKQGFGCGGCHRIKKTD